MSASVCDGSRLIPAQNCTYSLWLMDKSTGLMDVCYVVEHLKGCPLSSLFLLTSPIPSPKILVQPSPKSLKESNPKEEKMKLRGQPEMDKLEGTDKWSKLDRGSSPRYGLSTPYGSISMVGWWVAYEILLSAQGPLVLGFCLLGLRVLGQGLTTMGTPRIKIINISIFWTSCVYDWGDWNYNDVPDYS